MAQIERPAKATPARSSAAAHRSSVRRRERRRQELARHSRMGWLAAHACPACGSPNIRRSAIRGAEANAHAFRSPYRCENCKHRFWLVSRKARLGAATAGIVLFSAVVFVATLLVLPRYVVPDSGAQDIEAASEQTLIVRDGVVTPRPATAKSAEAVPSPVMAAKAPAKAAAPTEAR